MKPFKLTFFFNFQTAIVVEGMIYTGFLYRHLNMAHHLSTPQKLPVKTVFAPVHHLRNTVLPRTPTQVLRLIIRCFNFVFSCFWFICLHCTIAVAFLLLFFHSWSSCRSLFVDQSDTKSLQSLLYHKWFLFNAN